MGTVSPNTDTDPFRAARAASTRRIVRIGLVALVLALAVGLLAVLLTGRRTIRPALPSGVVAQLRAASFASPVDQRTRYRRFASLLPPGAELEAAALGEDGTLAVALRDDEQRLLVVRAGAVSATTLAGSSVSALAFAPDGELYVGFDDGRVSTLAARAAANALAAAARGAAPSSTVTGFAFDRATKRTAVLFAGGEVFTALRPFHADALRPVTIPANARVRLAAFTGDSDLAVAGDRGQVYVSSGDGWDAIPLATSGTVVALATDLSGELLAAQSNGELFRREGGWESLGQAPAPPVAIGELGVLGVVAVLSDGRVVGVQESHGPPLAVSGFVPRGPASTGQIAGMNVLVLSRQRLVVAEPGPASLAWSSDEVAGAVSRDALRACRVTAPPTRLALAAPLPMLVCGDAPLMLNAGGARPAPALRVSGRELPASELVRLLGAGRDVTYLAGQLVRAHYEDEPPSLLVFRTPELRYSPLVTLPPDEGSVSAWSVALGEAGTLEVVTVSANGTVRFARVTPEPNGAMGAEPLAAQLAASPAALALLREPVLPPRPVALGAGHILLAYADLPSLIARLDVAFPERLEPVPLPPDPPGTGEGYGEYFPSLFATKGVAWLSRPGTLERIGVTGDASRAATGVTLDHANGTLAADVSGRLFALGERELPGGAAVPVALDCDALRCNERTFPEGVVPSRIFLGDRVGLGVLERGGVVGLLGR